MEFDFNMAIWSIDEGLNTNSYIILEIKDSNCNWITYYSFDIANLSKNKNFLDSFKMDFEKEIYGLGIIVVTKSVTSTKNL